MLERNEDKRYAVKLAGLDNLVLKGHLLRKIECDKPVFRCGDGGG